MAWLPTRKKPFSGTVRRLTLRSSVDLPEPLGPMRATTSPLFTLSVMSLSTGKSPKDFRTPISSIMGIVGHVVNFRARLVAAARFKPVGEAGQREQENEVMTAIIV